jgi:hypothetical protein
VLQSKETYSLPGLPLFNIMLGALFGLPVGLAAAALVCTHKRESLHARPCLLMRVWALGAFGRVFSVLHGRLRARPRPCGTPVP